MSEQNFLPHPATGVTDTVSGPAPQLRGKWAENLALARHVSWRAGGNARRAYTPVDVEDLAQCLRTLPSAEPVLFIGLGSNLLIRDGGFPGTVILLHAALAELRLLATGEVYAAAGVASPRLASFSMQHGLTGAEFMAGIPGTVGGALAMNAGCYGSETWEIVAAVHTVDRQGSLRWRPVEDYAIAYRHVSLLAAAEEWFVGARFRLGTGDRAASKQQIKQWLDTRRARQPLNLPNAGSVFRNPPNDHAARLIEMAGLKNYRLGGAEVSGKHANFIVNPEGKATAADIEALILHIQAIVERQYGIHLIPEVRIAGVATGEQA